MKLTRTLLILAVLSNLALQFPKQNKVLLLIDNVAIETTHSIFINDLKGRMKAN